MGKYTKKSKMTAGVALAADASSQSYLGVRTHAKTLALQRLPSASAAALPTSEPDVCYLELRSRRLEKRMQPHNSPNTRRSCGGEDAGIGRRDEAAGGSRGIRASFEESYSDFDVSDRGTRESSPCSSIRGDNSTTAARGSTKNQSCSSAAMNAYAPSARELEEFFAREEQSMQRHFIEKYNFDVVGDLPLPGRYEWVAVRP